MNKILSKTISPKIFFGVVFGFSLFILIWGFIVYAKVITIEDSLYIINKLGIGTSSPASALSVGSTSQFQVNSSGNLIRINNVSYGWPTSQGGVSTFLRNDGSGNLSWAAVAAGGVTSIAAGSGLTASPSDPITSSGTLNVGAGTGISVAADTVNVKNTSFSCTGTDVLQSINIDTGAKTCVAAGGGAQGPPGPQGPRGLQGLQGPQGPAAPSAICTYDGHTYSTGAICEVGSRSCKWPDTCGGVSCPSFGYQICYIAQKCQSSGGWSAFDTIADYPSCK